MRIALSLALSLSTLAAAPAAQPDPCIGLTREHWAGQTYWVWHWYRLGLVSAAHIELVPTGQGIALLALFRGGDRLPAGNTAIHGFYPNPYCPTEQRAYLDAFWWRDDHPPRTDERLDFDRETIARLIDYPTGLRMFPGGVEITRLRDMMPVIFIDGMLNWHRQPDYWAALIRPGRGWW